ncbi:MAG: ABC transporter substrate-binding protein, partial [Bauldia sp.]
MRTIFNRLAAGGAVLALALSAGAADAGTITLYTSQPEADATRTVEAFKAANPGVEVEIFRSGTSDLLTKLAAEFAAGAPQPDVLLIADAVTMELLKKDNRLLAYPEADVEGLAQDSYDAERTYFGSKLITTGIAYNTAAAEKPESWADLVKPEYKDGVVMPSPLYSGAAAYMLSGFAGDPTYGWDYFQKLKDNNTISVRGNGAVLKSVASGEKPYGVLVDFMAMNAKKKGSPVEFVFPSEGVPAVTEPVAIMKTAKNVEDAKHFVDFILSDDGQKLA